MGDVDPLLLHVVDGLPMPLHVATAAPGVVEWLTDDFELEVDDDAPCAADDLPSAYARHPYWQRGRG